jgi:plasmid maintenance system antidote protein VapI
MSKNKDLAKWMEGKFIQWMAQTGERHTVTEFAEWLGIARPVVSRYLSGDRVPTGNNVDKIADRLGPEIYDLLGLQRPDPLLQEIQANWDILTDEEREQIYRVIANAIEGHRKST